MDTLIQDIRYGIRTLTKRPGFTFVAILALSLGIGANSAIFSVVNAVLLQPLSYDEPDRIVSLLHDGTNPVGPANYFDLKDQSQSFEAMAATQYWQPTLTGQDEPEQFLGVNGTSEMFQVFGVEPILGRTFLPDEDQPGNAPVVVLSYGLWQRRFGGSQSIIGQSITLNGEPHTIIGVMPEGYQFVPFWAAGAELCAPLNLAERIDDRGGQSLRVFARLKSGMTIENAQAEVSTIMSRLEQAYPDDNAGLTMGVNSVHDQVVGADVQLALLVLAGSVGFVLLIACANVANLLLGRALGRRKEIIVRMAVGANRFRVIRQLITESLLLAILGGIGGLLLAFWSIDALVAMSPASLPRVETIQLDAWVIGFTVLVSMGTGLIFGLVPAIQISQTDMSGSMKERGAGEGQLRTRFRGVLIVSEVALTLLLLIGAGLMMRTFLQLQNIDPGFNAQNLLTMTVSVSGTNQGEPQRRAAFYQQTVERAEALPGVEAASMINHLPLKGDLWRLSVSFEGQPALAPGDRVSGAYRVVMPGYFQAMGIQIQQGRDFTDRDIQNAPGVVMINETLARRHFPNEDPIGKRIAVGNRDNPEWLSIIGIVRDVKQGEWQDTPRNEVYLAYLQSSLYLQDSGSGFQYMTLVARTTGDPLSQASLIKELIWAIDKNVTVSQVVSMEQVVSEQLWQSRFYMFLLSVFAGVALMLAAIGLYGVMAYAVAQRTHEIGLRMALGAQRVDVFKLVIGHAMLLAVIGVGIGCAFAVALTRVMDSMLYKVSTTDPITFIGGALVLMMVALFACYIPARKAMHVDPLVALRYE